MSEFANVRSLDALRDMKAALVRFIEVVSGVLSAIDQELHQATDWFEHDRPNYWRAQVRRGFDQVAEARVALERCRSREVAGHRPSCYDERKALQAAKQRLEFTQQKIEVVRIWTIKVREEIDEFRGRLGALQRCLEADIPQTIGMLERSIAAIEAYADISSPETEE